jgi:hypothetical protein
LILIATAVCFGCLVTAYDAALKFAILFLLV